MASDSRACVALIDGREPRAHFGAHRQHAIESPGRDRRCSRRSAAGTPRDRSAGRSPASSVSMRLSSTENMSVSCAGCTREAVARRRRARDRHARAEETDGLPGREAAAARHLHRCRQRVVFDHPVGRAGETQRVVVRDPGRRIDHRADVDRGAAGVGRVHRGAERAVRLREVHEHFGARDGRRRSPGCRSRG